MPTIDQITDMILNLALSEMCNVPPKYKMWHVFYWLRIIAIYGE